MYFQGSVEQVDGLWVLHLPFLPYSVKSHSLEDGVKLLAKNIRLYSYSHSGRYPHFELCLWQQEKIVVHSLTEDTISAFFGLLLKTIRHKKKLSQKEVALRSEFSSRSTYSAYEAGTRKEISLQRIGRVLGGLGHSWLVSLRESAELNQSLLENSRYYIKWPGHLAEPTLSTSYQEGSV